MFEWKPAVIDEEEPVYTIARISSFTILGLMNIHFEQDMLPGFNISVLNEPGIIDIEMVPAMDESRLETF